jgi:hypothetical protein
MADFTSLVLAANTGTQSTPTWTNITGAGSEVRWSDVGTGLLSTASASWPTVVRPTSGTLLIPYTYAFTADATGLGFVGGASNPPTWVRSNYNWARWAWDNTGTFAAAPIFTAYNDTNHNSPTGRGGGGVLAGHTTDTGATARSYLKANAFGRVTSGGGPGAQPGADPVVTDGTTGSVSPGAGANWLTNFQALAADLDYITAPFTPSATTADSWHVHFALFTGANMSPGTLTWVLSLRYQWQ